MGWMAEETGLDKCQANYVPLTPLSHLQRAASVFAEQIAVVYGSPYHLCTICIPLVYLLWTISDIRYLISDIRDLIPDI